MATRQVIHVNITGTEDEKRMARALCSIPAGRFFRLRYRSDVRLASEYKNQGYTMHKVVDTTTRTGVKYSHIAGVVLNDGNSTRANNYEWVVCNRIKRNANTGKHYAVVAPIREGHRTKVTYILTEPNGISRPITRNEAMQYTIPSYWNSGDRPPVMNIELSHILRIK